MSETPPVGRDFVLPTTELLPTETESEVTFEEEISKLESASPDERARMISSLINARSRFAEVDDTAFVTAIRPYTDDFTLYTHIDKFPALDKVLAQEIHQQADAIAAERYKTHS